MAEPAMVEFIERIGMRKDGKGPRIKTHQHWWAICDVCGEGTWVSTDHFTKEPCSSCGARKCNPKKSVCCEGCRHPLGLRCRMTPKCQGKHRKANHG